MQNLVVGVDGSEVSVRAARQAVDLARVFGAKVILLNVVNPIILPGDAPWASLEEIQLAEVERGQQIVQEVQRAIGGETQALVKVGPTAQVIVEVAGALHDAMVVVGSTGKGVVKRMLVGSVADRVVHLCPVPVLVIR